MASSSRPASELVHVDVMDGVFCPQLTVGPPIVAAIRSPILKDVHLMIDDPLAKLDAFVAAGADLITFHVEGAPQPHRVLQVLGAASNVNDPARGIVRGIAINPSTPVGAIEPLLDELDYVLVLAVNPGWSGQRFIAQSTAGRIAEACASSSRDRRDPPRRRRRGHEDNVAAVAALGADLIVTRQRRLRRQGAARQRPLHDRGGAVGRGPAGR